MHAEADRVCGAGLQGLRRDWIEMRGLQATRALPSRWLKFGREQLYSGGEYSFLHCAHGSLIFATEEEEEDNATTPSLPPSPPHYVLPLDTRLYDESESGPFRLLSTPVQAKSDYAAIQNPTSQLRTCGPALTLPGGVQVSRLVPISTPCAPASHLHPELVPCDPVFP
jgi:hypothetical protein